MQRSAEQGLALAQQMQFGLVVDIASTQLALVRTLRGLTPQFGSFDDPHFDERSVEHRFSSNPDLARAECWYWIRRAQARYYAGDFATAVDASARAQRLLWTSLSNLERAEYYFYAALSHAAFADSAADTRDQHIEALVAHHRQIQTWAEHCPETFENRAALVGAEIARLQGRDLDARRLYEQAIRSARLNGFVHNEALSYEVAARHYAAGGFDEIARLYVRNARHCYLRWGADGKVRQLDQSYPQLTYESPVAGPTSTTGAPVEHLDLATVIKVSQAVSGEVVLEKMIDTLMRTAMAQAGAERSLLVLLRGAERLLAAEATTTGDAVTVQLREEVATADVLPESVLNYVMRTQESVILDDAAAQPSFAADPYIRERRARSILCLPLLNQAKLIGALYVENNLAPRVFAPSRIAVLKLIASQAAIALENTRLYRELAEREARIRRLVDANIIGILIADLSGQIVEANDAFLKMIGYGRDDPAVRQLQWTQLTPPEWRSLSQRAVAQVREIGASDVIEKEYIRKDGSRVPVLVASAALDERRTQSVSFVLDLSERKRAESEAREVERRYREAQMELARANRLATMGQLTASIAHEVNQPITGVVTNAQTALRFLDAQPVDLGEVRQILEDIVKGGNRASNVVGRIRDLIKKAPPKNDRLDINEAIRETIELARAETLRSSVSVKVALADYLPSICGDRVQLQQVVLNLILNAVEAMAGMSEESRSLLITTGQAESSGALVSVRDTGPGLPPAAIERLFEPFHTTKPNGMGMGLSICRSIVEAHGGRLRARANTPRGAVFEFTLPADCGPAS